MNVQNTNDSNFFLHVGRKKCFNTMQKENQMIVNFMLDIVGHLVAVLYSDDRTMNELKLFIEKVLTSVSIRTCFKCMALNGLTD